MSASRPWTREEIERWVASQTWYQTIPVAHGIVTPGTTDSRARLDLLGLPEDLSGKSVLDVGANSGMYCFECKRRGAARVVGIEPQPHRMDQARTLAEILGLEVELLEQGLLDSVGLGRFDLVFCFAVLTEVTDLIRSLQVLEDLTGGTLYLELAVFGRSPGDVRLPLRPLGDRALRRVSGRPSARLRRTKTGWSIAPSLDFLEEVLGHAFHIRDLGPSVRYRMLELVRRHA